MHLSRPMDPRVRPLTHVAHRTTLFRDNHQEVNHPTSALLCTLACRPTDSSSSDLVSHVNCSQNLAIVVAFFVCAPFVCSRLSICSTLNMAPKQWILLALALVSGNAAAEDKSEKASAMHTAKV